MSSPPTKAKAVVIGAGIVVNSMAYHLGRLGWRDLLQIDEGPLPNPGGSTGHASNFIYPTDQSKEMTQINSPERCKLHQVVPAIIATLRS